MVDKRCCIQVPYGSYFRSYLCQRKGTVEDGSKWYCWQHDPERVKKERKKAEEKMEKKWAVEKAETDVETRRPSNLSRSKSGRS